MNKILLPGLIVCFCLGLLPCHANQVLNMTVTETHVKNKSAPVKTTEDRTITLADYWFSVSTPHDLRIYDFDRKKLFVVSKTAKTYSECDLHALAFYRVSELKNRQLLQGALTAAKISTAVLGSFDNATELGIVPSGDKPIQIVDAKSGEQTTYSHDGKIIVTLKHSDKLVAKDCQKSYQRFITQECKIHPEIRKALIEGQLVLPNRLEFQFSPIPADLESVEYDLKSVTSEPSAPPMSLSGYTYVPIDSDMQAIYKTLNKFGDNPKSPKKEEAIAFSNKAIQEGKPLDALLSLLEYGLETGDQLTDQMRSISSAVKTDADAKRFFTSISPNSEQEAKEDVKNLASIDRSKLQKHAIVDIMQGNIEGQLGNVTDAKRLLVEALKKNPFIVGAYHDLADLYIHQYDMASAWECFKTGRRLQPNHPMFAQLSTLEKKLEEEHPEFF